MLNKLCENLILQLQNNKYDFLKFDLIKQEQIKEMAASIANIYESIIIIGFGASSLNIRALLSACIRRSKQIVYLDSLDQVELNDKLSSINLNKSVFFSLSKSGNTNETYLLTKYALESLPVSPRNMYIIAPFTDNLLNNLAQSFKTHFFEHDNICSGRFGIISNASLLPVAVAGLNISKVVAAATKKILEIISDSTVIYQIAEYYLQQYSLGRSILVMFNYSYQLDGLCKWQQQIIAETLGKNGFGITPVIARGTFDQHSQLQLYLEGPDDKFYKIITNNQGDSEIATSLATHANNIYHALIQAKRPATLINFEPNETIIVEQIIDTMLSIIVIAEHLKINPFNQPAVDQCKYI
ncbi:hypothetical protein [Candidatus Tisiphia endosymbiont of Beris chalybata]|uniref:hypothetical protein n=1 Tax=Candidatus Tisiphia endosymbiont of Beris chalybata TaxID=3066262 RepID=UPI00312C8EE4